MGISAEDEQAFDLTIERALVLRGAMNVAAELLERPGFDVTERFPVNRGQLRAVEALKNEIENEVQQAQVTGQRSYTQRVDPTEAQATRDVIGLLETLLKDPGGREILVEVGFLVDAEQPVDQQELDDLKAIRRMIEPTGVRPEAGEEPAGLRDVDVTGAMEDLLVREGRGPAVNFNDELESVIVNSGERIGQAEIGWQSEERAFEQINEVLDEFGGGRTNRDCDDVMKAAVLVTELAVAGARQTDIIDEWIRYREQVDAAYIAVLSSIETKHCVSRNAQDTLAQRFDEVTDELVRPVDLEAVEQAAQQLLVDLGATALGEQAGRDAEERRGFRRQDVDADNRLLGHIDQLRANLEETLESFPIEDRETLREAILESRPPSNAACEDYLVSLAELAVIAARLVVGEAEEGEEFAFASPRTAMVNRVQHERRLLFHRMGADFEVVDEPLPTPQRECADQGALRRLRNSFISILDPVADDPEDVETRAFAAISDIRDFFQDPRRGP